MPFSFSMVVFNFFFFPENIVTKINSIKDEEGILMGCPTVCQRCFFFFFLTLSDVIWYQLWLATATIQIRNNFISSQLSIS